MHDIRIVTGKQIMPDCTVSLRLAGYQPQAGWEKGEALFHELERMLRITIQPKAAFAMATHTKLGRVLYVVLTLGASVQRKSDAYFTAHEYTKGMLFDAMADSCLFAFEEQLHPLLEAFCREHGVGITKRYESGMNEDMALQQDAATAVEAERTLGVTCTVDDMLLPVKSMSIAYALSEQTDSFATAHDCQSCTKRDCPMREKETYALCRAGIRVSEQLQSQQVPLFFPCGGAGSCGKCRIRVIRGTLDVTAEDERIFTPEELRQGWRLACRAIPKEEIEIVVPVSQEHEFVAVGQQNHHNAVYPESQNYGLAIDIGTTTIAVSLVDRESGQAIQTVTAVNSQRRYGADVISRIQAANDGQLSALQQCVRQDIQQLFQQLWTAYPLAKATVHHAVVAANTTMLHLLMGWDCRGLGAWPFHPYSLGGQTYEWRDVFGTTDCEGTVMLLPGISTYVGADITAGIWQCAMHRQSGLTLLLDLGTNGEMAIGNQHGFLTASTAAGPALEGGNLTWGTGSVPGAICHVSIQHRQAHVQTIQGASPCGICGSGVIDTMAGLVQQQLVDEKGRLCEPYFTQGFPLASTINHQRIVLTQQDIRNIQLAKSAVRAGLEVLIHQAGATYDTIDHVYLAGGFGLYLRPEQAGQIGLLPQELIAKTSAVGNTSLQGATAAVCHSQVLPAMKTIVSHAQDIVLSNHKAFQDMYIQYMDF